MTDRLELETQCKTCGRRFTPQHADYVRGVWQRCPRCRAGPETQGPTGHMKPTQRVTGDVTASDSGANEQNEGKTP